MRTVSCKLHLVIVSVPKLDYPEDQLAGGPSHKPNALRTAHTSSRQLSYHLSATFIRFDSVGSNKTYLSGGLDNWAQCDGCIEMHLGFGISPTDEDADTCCLSAHRCVQPDFEKRNYKRSRHVSSAHVRLPDIRQRLHSSFIARAHTSS
jgi:hypothetical protein